MFRSPLCNNHNFIPAKLDKTFTVWHRKGIIRFSDFYINGVFSNFDDLRSKYDLQQNDLFRFFQVRQFAKSHSPQIPYLPERSIIDKLLDISCLMKQFTPHTYSMIRSMDTVKLERIKASWEKELGTELSEDLWTAALNRVNGSTS